MPQYGRYMGSVGNTRVRDRRRLACPLRIDRPSQADGFSGRPALVDVENVRQFDRWIIRDIADGIEHLEGLALGLAEAVKGPEKHERAAEFGITDNTSAPGCMDRAEEPAGRRSLEPS